MLGGFHISDKRYTYFTNISTEEWIEVLKNKSVINQKMLDILKIIYQFENHAATTLEIRMVRSKLGYAGEKSYNSLIVQNAKRVKEYLKKDALINDDGEEVFWGFFFDGEYLKGKGIINTEVKVGKSANSGGWSLSRTDLNEFLPIDDYEGNYPITVDGIKAEGRFNINARLFYRSDELKEHLEELANENPDKKIPLELEFKDENKKGFEFTLKDELIGAIETLYDTLEVKYPHSLKFLEDFDEESNNTLDDFYSLENNLSSHDYLSVDTDVSFYDYLLEKGYLFDKETIENYLLSLKVKPFAILTGNSGTGKTKLSQLFAQYINKVSLEDHASIDYENSPPEEYLYIKLNINKTAWEQRLWTVEKNNFRLVFPFKEIDNQYDVLVDGIKCRGFITLLTRLNYYDNEFKSQIKDLYENGEEEIFVKIKMDDIKRYVSDDYIQASDSINFDIDLSKNDWNVQKTVCDYIPINYKGIKCNIIYKDKTYNASLKPNLLFSIRDKSNLNEYIIKNRNKIANVELFVGDNFNFENFKPDFNLVKEDNGKNFILENNYKIIPVGANWTENRNIVGYYNVITDQYNSTPAYDLIKQAQNSNEPHFLILDEMNLSHVERYFADFLSAIESGESIPLYGHEDLIIPDNLFIIGTVNVDETTYMFSPKVLDRANVLEFETFSAKDYMNDNISLNAPEGNIDYLENPLAGNNVRNLDINELRELFSNTTVNEEDFWNILSKEINEFQSILSKSGFDFGFRVINEIVRFMAVAWEYENCPDEFSEWTRYFDACIKQKLLPKLHGSEKIIGETLDELYAKCVDKHITYETAVYPNSARKLGEMREVLRKQRYVSFIN